MPAGSLKAGGALQLLMRRLANHNADSLAISQRHTLYAIGNPEAADEGQQADSVLVLH